MSPATSSISTRIVYSLVLDGNPAIVGFDCLLPVVKEAAVFAEVAASAAV
jgi:hypothetical protein